MSIVNLYSLKQSSSEFSGSEHILDTHEHILEHILDTHEHTLEQTLDTHERMLEHILDTRDFYYILLLYFFPTGNYIFKVNNTSTRAFTPCSSASIVNFEQINAGCTFSHIWRSIKFLKDRFFID